MTEFNRDQIVELLNDVCPNCKAGLAVKKSKYADKAWQHETHNKGAVSVTLCLATHLRDKYEKVLNG